MNKFRRFIAGLFLTKKERYIIYVALTNYEPLAYKRYGKGSYWKTLMDLRMDIDEEIWNKN